jgi:hypothetical protein
MYLWNKNSILHQVDKSKDGQHIVVKATNMNMMD